MRTRSRGCLGLVLALVAVVAVSIVAPPAAFAVCQASGKSCVLNTATNDRLCCPGMLCGRGNVCQVGCRINGTFYPGQARNPANACQACQPGVSLSAWSNVVTGTSCNDGNACTTVDTCSAGACVGSAPLNCNDGNVCTTDTCNPATGCVRSNNTLACDDSTVCNGHEVCAGGACGPGTPLDCNDSKVCTTDTCDPVLGCRHANNTLACDDATLCNGREVCGGGTCNGGAPPLCDDGRFCTTDSCDALLGCRYIDNALPCDDSTVCNGREVCEEGGCTRLSPPSCDDHNECTDDLCHPVTGCYSVNNSSRCDQDTKLCSSGICVPCPTACTGFDTCGGGGVPAVCGCTLDGLACTGKNCGTDVTNCGQTMACGSCSLPETCGGAGTPGVCAIPPGCVNLCLQQVTCANPAVTTTVTGKVFAPNGIDPIYDALVYVPNAALDPFTPGISCGSCAGEVSGAPLVSARTTFNGSFVLQNVPVGANIPLVLQVGRWRRQVSIPIVTSCGNTAIPAALARLPRTQAEGEIPLMAFATGNADAFECVLRKMGVADSEFTIATGTGRVHLYRGLDDAAHNAFGGAGLPGGVPESVLWGTQAQLDRYDMVFLPCQGGPAIRTAAAHQNFLGYVNGGGRVLATHFSYIWLDGQAPFDGTASWNPSSGGPADQNGFINLGPPDGIALAQWLVVTGASTTLGRLPLLDLRQDISSGGISAPSRLWLSLNDPTLGPVPIQYSFDAPVGDPAAQQCGRVLFDDVHFETASAHLTTFPAECTTALFSPQERLLEFMIFNMSACIGP